MSYSSISNFGSGTSVEKNPLTYCMIDGLDRGFLHGGYASENLSMESKNCQEFISEKCSKKWDGFCEISTENKRENVPMQNTNFLNSNIKLTLGESLLVKTAEKKYLIRMNNGIKKEQLFDPMNASSAKITYWEQEMNGKMIPEYSVNPKTIDTDPVMNKILRNPRIAANLLINIFNTMKRYGTLRELKGTKLGYFYKNTSYFKNASV